jgi:hypothetical protein
MQCWHKRCGNFLSEIYGYHDYYKKQPVENTDLYELPLYKVVATEPALMYLEEQEQIT